MDAGEIIRRAQAADLLRFTTAGSVDDGKSTLIGRLLHDSRNIYEDHLTALRDDSRRAGRDGVDFAFLTDGLKAEREQGITIDVAYRHFATPRRRFIIADTPGHVQYTRNMVTGASTANLAVILIDARKGVTTQSKRHAFIAALLGIPHMVVAVNKMDLVDYSRQAFETIREDFAAFAGTIAVQDLVFIPISALHGDNVVRPATSMPWYDGPSLLAHLESVRIAADHNLTDFRLPVQYVLRPDAGFRGYCGSIASGALRVGDQVTALPSGHCSRVTRILAAGGDAGYASVPQAVTVCLEDDLDIGRGYMLSHPGNLPSAAVDLEATIIWMDEDPLQVSRRYLVKHTTNIVGGSFDEVRYRIEPDDLGRTKTDSLRLNEIGRVRMHLHRPIFCDAYQHNRQTGAFVVIDPLSNATVGAGMVVDSARDFAAWPSRGIVDEPRQFQNQSADLAPQQRAINPGRHPVTVWLTGLSASGKSTIARALERRLSAKGCACFLLDGDSLRKGLNRDLGFSPEDRRENIRRAAEVAKLMNEAGLIVIAAFISPFACDRHNARDIIGPGRFIEVYVDVPIEVCEQRDPKGLYREARAGRIPEFTGISSPYEPPENPEIRLDAEKLNPQECADMIDEYLQKFSPAE